MRRLFILSLNISLLLLIPLLQACSSDPEDEETLELNVTELNFSNVDETKTVQLTSNARWMALSNETWCTIDPVKGNGNAGLDINCLENTGEQERTAKIVFKTEGGTVAREIAIKQLGTSPSVVVSPKTKTVSKDGETFDVEITSNVEFELIFPDEWIKEAVISRADGKTVKALEIMPNTEVDERKGEVIFKQMNGAKADTLRITQPGQGIRIQVDAETKRFGAAKTEFSIEVYADVEFETIIEGNWIKEKVVTRTAATGGFSAMKTFVAEKNTQPSERTTRIIFKQKDELLADTVTVTQDKESDLSGKNLVKSLIAVTEQGTPATQPDRDEMHFNYDSQGRLTQVSILKDYVDGVNVYVHESQAYVTYNADNDVEKVEEYGSNLAINRSKELINKAANVLKYRIVEYNNGIAEEGEILEVKLNDQGRVTEIGTEAYQYRYSYNAGGDLTKYEMHQNGSILGNMTYQYDDKNGMFSVAQPIYALWLIPEFEKPLWFLKNNVKRIDINAGGTYSLLVNYEYNSEDFPVKATVNNPTGNLWYVATYY